MHHFEPGSFKILYVYSIDDDKHKNRLKVGDATYHTDKSIEEIIKENTSSDNKSLFINTSEIEAAARKRIDEQTKTADVEYQLLWTSLAVRLNPEIPGHYLSFRDYDIHRVLMRSGVSKKFTRADKNSGEWFETTLDKVKEAFIAHSTGKDSIDNTQNEIEITLRVEQQKAIDETVKVFRKGSIDTPKEFLWNAIMRFGKTLTSYALVKKLEETQDIEKVLIMTHRPVVASGWHEDFGKSFKRDSGWTFGSKKVSNSWETLQNSKKFFYFASIQDLRGSFNETIEENKDSDLFKKNADIFNTDWGLVIVDEGHEGNQTDLAQQVNDNIRAKYKLHLSGTPFNIINDFDSDHVYNWTYIDEQKTVTEWSKKHATWVKDPQNNEYCGDTNPYANLVKLEIRNYDINEVFKNNPAVDPNSTRFNFAKFFEVSKNKEISGKIYNSFKPFVNAASVDKLLNLISTSDENGKIDEVSGKAEIDHRNYPFSRDNSKRDFAHTFWVLPTVEAAIALHERLNLHPNFSDFKVVNATGNNDGGDALKAVKEAIKNNERTITLSVGKLTTGTTIPEWTAIFMLTNMRSPMLYMQTIFRVKSSGSLSDGRQKEVGYVFDFAPDRSLEMLSESVANTAKAKPGFEDLNFQQKEDVEREEMDEMLKYLPVIAYDGARFNQVDTNSLMKTMERVYINRTVDSGFHDARLFKFDFHGLTPADMDFANSLTEVVGKSSMDPAIKKLTISKSLLSEADKKILENSKPPREASDKEKSEWDAAAEHLDADRKNARKVIQLLRGISARIPMLVFATDLEETVTVENFANLVDDESWSEFMPKGFTKESWDKLKEFFNRTVFEGACEEIQRRTKKMDSLSVIDRAATVANLFASFRSPDKETILTPWSTVNRQYADTLGGFRMIDNDGKWFTRDTEILKDFDIDKTFESSVMSHTWEEIEDSDGQLVLNPQWAEVDQDLQKFWKDQNTTILDINSKTALYPLYGALSLWFEARNNLERKHPGEIERRIEDLLWAKIIEDNIFVNCRVPYSRKIAERVLTGYKVIKNDNGKSRKIRVNSSVVDIMEVRAVLKNAKLPKYTANGDLAKNKRSLTDEEVNNVWKWIFSPDAMRGRNESEKAMTETRAKRVINLAENIDEDGFEKLLKEVEKSMIKADEIFSAIVSNPPYQENLTENTSKAKPVWPDFVLIGSCISKLGSFINPARWQRGGNGTGLAPIRDYFFTSGSLKKFITLPDNLVFPGVGIGDVSIELLDFVNPSEKILSGTLKNGILEFDEYSPSDEIDIILKESDEELVIKVLDAGVGPSLEKELWVGGQDNKTVKPSSVLSGDSRSDYGIMVSRLHRDTDYFILNNEKESNKDYVTVYYMPGKGIVNERFILRSEMQDTEKNNSRIPKWKALIPKTHAHFLYRNLGPIGVPNSLATNTWLCRSFNSKIEVIGYLSYVKTFFYRYLVSIRATSHNAYANVHRFVPDLVNIINPRTNLVGYESDWTDEDLKKLFKDVLTEDDWAYIEKTAIESDPVGAKK